MDLINKIKKRIKEDNLNLKDFNIPKIGSFKSKAMEEILIDDFSEIEKHIFKKEIPYIKKLYYNDIKGSFRMRKVNCKECNSKYNIITKYEKNYSVSYECMECGKKEVVSLEEKSIESKDCSLVQINKGTIPNT